MNSLEKKLKLLNCENIDISTDEFYFIFLKLEEEKIRLYKPKDRQKLNYEKEKNYIEHMIKYLKKLNINTRNINKQNFNDFNVRTYILNNLATLALIDDYKDLIDFDEQEKIEGSDEDIVEEEKRKHEKKHAEENKESNKKNEHSIVPTESWGIHSHIEEQNNKIKNNVLKKLFEIEYFKNMEKEELKKQEENINILSEKINKIFEKCDLPLLKDERTKEEMQKSCDVSKEHYKKNGQVNKSQENKYQENAKAYSIASALLLIREKLRNKNKIENANYHEFFGLNIDVNNKELADFLYIIKYLFNDLLTKRKKCIKKVLNDIQILTYNPIIDIKQGKVGR